MPKNRVKMGIQTQNRSYRTLIDRLEEAVAGGTDPVLLTGAPGTGKTELAHMVYEYKKRLGLVKGPLVVINCGILEDREALIAIFGKSGDKDSRQGALAGASGGMLFLDEAERLSAEGQRRFLYALEAGRYRPLNSTKEERCDFLLISAAGTGNEFYHDHDTNKFLSRIGLWNFTLPSLAERPEDILPNIQFALTEYGRKNGLSYSFEPEALEEYAAFAQSPQARWMGNFRDLNQSLRRLIFTAGEGTINTAHVKKETEELLSRWDTMEGNTPILASVDTDSPCLVALPENSLPEQSEAKPQTAINYSGKIVSILDDCDEFDRAQLIAVLEVCCSSNTMAAAGRRLFAKSRTQRISVNDSDRLKKYLARFGLDWEMVK